MARDHAPSANGAQMAHFTLRRVSTTGETDVHMPAREQREIERFAARSDDGAYETTIVVYQDLIDVQTRANPHARVPGLKDARTSEGHACNRIDDDTWEVVQLGLIVRRIR